MLASRVAVGRLPGARRLRTMRFARSRVLPHRVLVAHGRGHTLGFLDGKIAVCHARIIAKTAMEQTGQTQSVPAAPSVAGRESLGQP